MNKAMKNKPIRVTELALRDAHQSLLATRMHTDDMLPICAEIDRVGYWSVEAWGGATFDTCLRFLGEDPWERLRALKKALPNTPLQMLLRGQNILGYRHYSDDVVERFVNKAAENGIAIFRIFDALNDPRNLETSIKSVLKNNAHAQGAISYTVSPVHTLNLFVKKAKQIEEMGCQSLCIKDMAALLLPVRAFELVSALKEAVKIPIHVHSHATTGVAAMSLLKAVEAGAAGIDTAISPLSFGTSHPATESMVVALQDTPYDTGLSLDKLEPIAQHFREIKPKYNAFLSKFTNADTRIFTSQIPGGMLSNLENQLREMGHADKIDEVLAEVPHVRAEMGNVPLVTPSSQIVGAQAVINVVMGRYKIIPFESKNLFAGKYGATAAPVDPEIQKLALKKEEPITCRPADLLPNEWDKLKAEVEGKARNEEDVLSYALFPPVWLDYYEKHIKDKDSAPTAK